MGKKKFYRNLIKIQFYVYIIFILIYMYKLYFMCMLIFMCKYDHYEINIMLIFLI
jgi:hypothetical protein